jgi:hypothetical protein
MELAMTTQTQKVTQGISRRTVVVLTLIAAAVVAIVANFVVSLSALAAGADTTFAPLVFYVFGPFTVLGLLAGYVGWRIVRTRAKNPLHVLRVLVPVLAVLSFVPDTVSAIVGFIPGTTVTGFVGLMIMHLVVVGVGVPVYQRLAPVSAR